MLAMQEEMPVRGFESTSDSRLLFGLGKVSKIDSVVVQWTGGKESVLYNVKPDSRIIVKQSEAVSRQKSEVSRQIQANYFITQTGDRHNKLWVDLSP